MQLQGIVIGSSHRLILLWLVRVITLVWDFDSHLKSALCNVLSLLVWFRKWTLAPFVGKVLLYSAFWTLLKNCGSLSENGWVLESGCWESGRLLFGLWAVSAAFDAIQILYIVLALRWSVDRRSPEEAKRSKNLTVRLVIAWASFDFAVAGNLV